jgi:DNA-binding beta-propeller fold protein YncE
MVRIMVSVPSLALLLLRSWLLPHALAAGKQCTHHCQHRPITVTIGFSLPTGIAVDTRGNVYIADNDARIRKFSPKGQLAASWGAKGTGPGQFNTPNLFAADAQGNLYVPDTENNRIQKLSAKGVPLAQWGSSGARPGQFDRPLGVTVDAQGNVYVADSSNNRIQKLSPAGVADAGWGASVVVHHCADVAVDPHGHLFVSDSGNNRILKLAPDGHAQTFGANLYVGRPTGLAFDKAGNLYVADRSDGQVLKISARGVVLARWGSAGSGSKQFAFRSQNRVNGVAVDPHGNIWVADTSNNRVKELSPQGVILELWK